jgi:hypothetical protein
MGDWIAFTLLQSIFLWPLFVGATRVFEDKGKKHYESGEEFEPNWWFPITLVFCGIYCLGFMAACALGMMSFFSHFFMYGFLPLIVFIFCCRNYAKYAENWTPIKEPEQQNESAIFKTKDILDTAGLFNILNVTFDYGSPLVCLGNQSENDPNNLEKKFSDDEKSWRKNTEKARVSNEDRGLIVGAPGSGKTTYLVSQLIDWMQSGKSFVATDIKPEIWAILKENGVFERFGYKDWVINPTDTQSHHYNIFSEAISSAELNEILSVLIPSGEESAEVFAENARRLLKAVVLELGENASLHNCQRYINNCDDVPELIKQLKQSENDIVVSIAKDVARTAKNDNLLSSIMTSLSKAFAFLDDDRIRTATSNSDLALKEVLLKPKQAIFLQFEQSYKSTTATLFGAMVAHTLRILQSNYRKRDDVFVALDEIINCAPIPKFLDTLNTMRSAKMPTFLYLQALEGLNRVYGQGADRLFMGACDFKAVYKIGDIETAKVFSDLIGVTEVKITNHSSSDSSSTSSNVREVELGFTVTNGQTNSVSSSNSTSVVTQIMAIIEPDQFIKLKMHDAVCIYQGEATIFHMPIYFKDYPVLNRPQFPTMSEYRDHHDG